MATPHISAEMGDVAATVLMPGDPLRAKFIAENYLRDARLFNEVRGMLGYTGLYRGAPVSVMGSGMGMPSMGIYAWELYRFYGVERIIRVGSAGAYSGELEIFDLLLARGAYTESSFARVQSGYGGDERIADETLCEKLRESAASLNVKLVEGKVHSSDVFYRMENTKENAREEGPPGLLRPHLHTWNKDGHGREMGRTPEGQPRYWEKLLEERGCVAVEMESFALFQTAAALGKSAACLLTISDSFVNGRATTSEERERSFTRMMEVALGAAVV